MKEGDYWALYFDRDGDNLKSKLAAGVPVIEIELIRRELRTRKPPPPPPPEEGAGDRSHESSENPAGTPSQERKTATANGDSPEQPVKAAGVAASIPQEPSKSADDQISQEKEGRRREPSRGRRGRKPKGD